MKNRQNLQQTFNNVINDITSALISSFLAKPFVTVVDRAIITNANGSLTIYKSLMSGYNELLQKPFKFYKNKEVFYVWFVYFNTFGVSNLTQTICRQNDINKDYPELIATFAANHICGVLKDKFIAQQYGYITLKKLPLQSYLFFLARDLSAISLAFTFPRHISQWLEDYLNMEKANASIITQLGITPLLIQAIATPFHLLALDYYNNYNHKIFDRISFVRKEYFQTCSVVYLRFLPLYGFGKIINNQLQQKNFISSL